MEGEYRITLKNTLKHFMTVNKHKWNVFKLCCKAGIPWRGIVHDLSKYSPIEFWNSVKYYQNGKKSPIPIQKIEEGYSNAWLHHRGRNKHHPEYWYDAYAPESAPVMPYKYTIEMICDKLSASITYEGRNWKNDSELKHWNKNERDMEYINNEIKKVLDDVFLQVSEQGINKTITKDNLKCIYYKYCQ